LTAAERMQAMRGRRRKFGTREVSLNLPDARLGAVRQRISSQVARVGEASERDALEWMETVSAFDDDASR
jgi:hypothetical protein